MVLISCQKDDSTNGNSTSDTGPQITNSTVIASLQPNTKSEGYRLDSGIIDVPDPGINLSFNYANVAAGVAWSDSLKAPVNLTDYPASTYMTGINQSVLGQSFAINQYFQLSNTNWSNLGGYFGSAFNFSYSGYSLNVPSQATKNNPVQTLVNFPIKYNDSINQSSASVFTIQIGATISGISISGPLTTNTITTVKSKNIAFGYLKLRGYTDSMQVVVQKYSTEVKTSFSSINILINSLLTTVLSQFNLSNNQTVYSTEYNFWAKDKGLVMRRQGNGVAYIRTGL